jgi:UPF0716 protein FxsA
MASVGKRRRLVYSAGSRLLSRMTGKSTMLRPFRVLLLAFIAVPLLEIFLFVQVGERIGAWPTVGLVVLTAILGVGLLQMQGLETWSRAQMSLLQGALPAQELLEGAVLLVSGALLLTPGFFTDALGFLGLLPWTRRWAIRRWLRGRFSEGPGGRGGRGGSGGSRFEHYQGEIIEEGEIVRERRD